MSIDLRPTIVITGALWMFFCGLSGQEAWGSSPQKAPATRTAKLAKHTSARKLSKRAPLQKANPQHTIILPIRYIRGSRIVRLLRMFLSRKEMRKTELRYSPSIHKLLIRAEAGVLERLKKAHEQLDVPQVQFRLRIFFVRAEKASTAKGQNHALFSYLKKLTPRARGFSLVSSFYIRATNHHHAEFKLSPEGQVADNSFKFVLHQSPNPNANILMELKIVRHQAFSTTSRQGTNTQFISSTQLQTKLFVQPGALTLVGNSPWSSRGKPEQVLVIVKVERHQDTVATKQGKVAKKASAKNISRKHRSSSKGSLSKQSIQQVIRRNQSRFKHCYERVLMRIPTLKGRVVVGFTINAKGRTTHVKLRKSSMKNQKVESCLLARFRTLQFPRPRGGGIVRVNYPLVFSPQ